MGVNNTSANSLLRQAEKRQPSNDRFWF